MADEVVVTGWGVLSAAGFGEQALRESVFAGRPAFGPVTRFDPSPYRTAVAAQGSYRGTQGDALRACTEAALQMAGLRPPLPAATLLATQGEHRGITDFWRSSAAGTPADHPALLASLPSSAAHAIGAGLGLEGRRATFTSGCIASTNAIIHGARLISAGREQVAVCGGAYLVDEEFFAKFDSGRAFATDGQLRAFSADRTGLLLGDGVAVLVLESRRHAATRGVRPLATLRGWGMAADGYHVCRPHPEGAGLAAAIRDALRRAGLRPDDVDYVNAHGTGTPLNDVAETRGLRAALGPRAGTVPVSSTKTTTGHALEGSGALEAVISLLAMRDGLLPPTAGYTAPDPECALDCVPLAPRPAQPRHVLSTNSAFGGVNAALLFGPPDERIDDDRR